MGYKFSDPNDYQDEYYSQGASLLDPNDELAYEYAQQYGFGAPTASSGGILNPELAGKAKSGMINPAIPIGLNLVGGIFKSLKSDPAAAVRKRAVKGMEGEIGKNPFNVNKYLGMLYRQMIPRARVLGEQADRRFGFDTGRGQGYLLGKMAEEEAAGVLDFAKMNDQAKLERDMRYRLALANYQG